MTLVCSIFLTAVCAECKQKIAPQQSTLEAVGQVFHSGCLKCHICHELITLDQAFGREKRIFCRACLPPLQSKKERASLRSSTGEQSSIFSTISDDFKKDKTPVRSSSRHGLEELDDLKASSSSTLDVGAEGSHQRSSIDITEGGVDDLRQPDFSRIVSSALPDLKKGSSAYPLLDPSDFALGDQVAMGSSAKIYKARWRMLPQHVAVKVLSVENDYLQVEFNREIALLTSCFGACVTKTECWIVMEWIPNGNLFQYLKVNAVQLRDQLPHRLRLAYQIAVGLDFLHRSHIIHRDVKSENVLLTEEYDAKLIDFGSSREVDSSKTMTNMTGTVCWMAPEIFNKEPYNQRADIYSYGIVLWELVAVARPFPDLRSWEVPPAVCSGVRPPIPPDTPPILQQLIERLGSYERRGLSSHDVHFNVCWHPTPSTRLDSTTLTQALQKIANRFGAMV